MTVATIPASVPFLDRVVSSWLTQDPAAGQEEPGTILVPSRRAARAMMEAFLRRLDGRAALLPRIVSVGDIDEETFLSAALEEKIPPAVEPQRRLALLTRLILQAPFLYGGHEGGIGGVERAWPLARSLAELMDEAERNKVDLARQLPEAVEENFADHWRKTLEFLKIITVFWPQWLAENGVINPVARQVALLEAQAESWRDDPPRAAVWAVGFTDGAAAVAELLRSVAALPEGRVVLPGVDLTLEDSLWDALPDTHPQAQLKALLDALGLARADVEIWGPSGENGRARLMRDAFVPEAGIALWGAESAKSDASGLYRLPAGDQQQEAQAIALILRDTVSLPGRSGALVTPDRALAQRVATELRRFGIHADDSAGEPLSRTPAAVFLRLVSTAASCALSPVALLSVLKHPLASLGMTPGTCRASARFLERRILRGPAPAPGIAGLREILRSTDARHRPDGPADLGASADTPDRPEPLTGFIDRIERCFAPLLTVGAQAALPVWLDALIRSAEALAACADEPENGDRPGARLWLGEDGAALSRHLAELMVYTADLPEQPLASVEGFLTVSMAGLSLTGLRGHRDGMELAHPRISILGVLEARLLGFDRVVLGGLNETVWPPATDPGPWLSRPMRQKIGLPSPERQIGVSARDFVAASLASAEIVFANAARRDGSPCVPARWIMRLTAFLAGRGQSLPVHPALLWQNRLDQPEKAAVPVPPPEPKPPVALRPRRLSVTAIDRWKQDPYAIYAQYILRVEALLPLEQKAEYADFGLIVHQALETMFARYPHPWPDHASDLLRDIFFEVLDRATIRPSLAAWWRPRLRRIAAWVAGQQKERALQASPDGATHPQTHTEVSASFALSAPAGPFVLSARADRIDLTPDGRAVIFDYKTGQLPSGKDVALGWSSQLVLEAALLGKGAFAGLPAAEAVSLVYWHLTGGFRPGEEKTVPGGRKKEELAPLIGEALENLRQLVADYDDPARPYRSQPWAGRLPRYTDYAQLARVEEWRAAYSEDDA